MSTSSEKIEGGLLFILVNLKKIVAIKISPNNEK
jgi:hypothetical protein